MAQEKRRFAARWKTRTGESDLMLVACLENLLSEESVLYDQNGSTSLDQARQVGEYRQAAHPLHWNAIFSTSDSKYIINRKGPFNDVLPCLLISQIITKSFRWMKRREQHTHVVNRKSWPSLLRVETKLDLLRFWVALDIRSKFLSTFTLRKYLSLKGKYSFVCAILIYLDRRR